MPHFRLETNVPQEKIPKDLPKKICELVATLLGKPEDLVVATLIGGVNVSWDGTEDPAAQASLLSIGALGVQENKKYSKALFELITKEIGIRDDRMYIQFINAAQGDVGYQGITFDDIFGS